MQFQVLNSSGVAFDITGVLLDSMVDTRIINADYNLDFTIVRTAENEQAYQTLDTDRIIIYNGQRYVVQMCPDNGYSKAVTAIHEFYELNDDFVQGEVEEGVYTPLQLLTFCLSSSPDWTLNLNATGLVNVQIEKFGNNNPVALIQQLMELLDAEFEPNSVGKVLNVRKRLGTVTNFEIEYKKNLITSERNVDMSGVKTAVRVYYNRRETGEYNSTFLYQSPNVGAYRRLKLAAPIYLDDVTSQSVATTMVQSMINDIPQVSISTTFANLQEAGFNSDSLNLGDTVRLIDERINEFGQVRIVQIQKYPLMPGRSPDIILANRPKSLFDAVIQERQNRESLDNLVVKQTEIYNGVQINSEGLTVKSRTGLITININANEGINIIRGSISVFRVDTNGNLMMDGNLLVTNGNGATPLLQAYRDARGGILNIHDINGFLVTRLGVEEAGASRRGGSLQIYSSSSSTIERVKIDTGQNALNDGGRITLTNSNGVGTVVINSSTTTPSITLQSAAGQTYLSSFEGFIGGQEIATQQWVRDNFQPL